MDNIINLSLLKNPFNWAIVFLMLAIAGIAGHLIAQYVGVSPATTSAS